MKSKRVIAALVAVIMLVAVMPVSAFAGRTPSGWARPEMDNANTSGLLTANAAKDFSRSLSRDEFCEMVVLMAEKALDAKLPLPAKNPFTDCNSEYVQKAFQFGIVNGRSATIFDPNASVSRQEIAAMMYRAFTGIEAKLGKVLLSPPVASLTFKDSSKIHDYAIDPVRYAVANGIFKGDDMNNFNPLNAISAEECVAVIIRSNNSAHEKLDAGLTSSQLLDKTMKNLNIGYAYGDSQSAVSRNVILPTKGAGNSVITWASSNPSVITAAGTIVSATGSSVTLTATATLGSSTRTASFTLTTTSLSGDQLLVQNAKTALEIGFFNEKDTVDSVTGRVFLPTTVMGLDVSWYSDRPSVVALTGEVTVPTDNSVTTVNITASFGTSTTRATKVFVLKVRNPASVSDSISLHNIKLGMSLSDVTKVLNSEKSSLTLASGESWYFFHTANTYNNFIAVAMRANKVVGVYTMVNGWETYLRDASTSKIITVAEANSAGNVKVDTYTDATNSNKQYAAFMYDTTSTIATERSLNVSATETFVAMLVNAYRYLFGNGTGKNALTNDAVLSNSARSHSSDMDSYEYFSATGRVGSTTYATRAASAGSSAAILGGVIAYNSQNPFDFLNAMISNSTDRSNILSATAGQFGVGYSGSYSGAYKTLLTLVFASSTNITSVTANVTSVSVPKNSYTDVILTFNPSTFTESFTVESSDSNRFTVALQSTSTNTRTYRITGRNDGSTNLLVRGADNRVLLTLPVTVGTTYANSLTVQNVYTEAANKTLQLASATVPTSGPVVTWAIEKPYSASPNANQQRSVSAVSSTGVATLTGQVDTATARATVARSATANFTATATIYADRITFTSGQSVTLPSGTAQSIGAVSTLGSVTFTYTSNNNAVATVNTSGTINAVSAGVATITVTASRVGCTGTIVKTISVIVQSSDYADSVAISGAGISGSSLNLTYGAAPVQLLAVTTPATVTHGTPRVWTSSNPAAATVDSATGVLTVVGVGETEIRVSVPALNNGSLTSAPLRVVVSPAIVLITSKSGDYSVSLNVGNNIAMTNFYDISPVGAVSSVTVSWDSTNSTVAYVDASGNLVGVGAGTAVLTGTVTINNLVSSYVAGDKATFTVTVN